MGEVRTPRKECCRLGLVGGGARRQRPWKPDLVFISSSSTLSLLVGGGRDDGEEHLLGNYWGSGVVILTMYITHFIPYANLTD